MHVNAIAFLRAMHLGALLLMEPVNVGRIGVYGIRFMACSSSGEPYAQLLHRLGSELTLQLMVQLLTEQKLLFVSVMPDLLVNIIQQLIMVRSPHPNLLLLVLLLLPDGLHSRTGTFLLFAHFYILMEKS